MKKRNPFAFDPEEALRHLRAGDPLLAALIDRHGPFAMEPTRAKSLFEALLRSIVYQQLHGKAAASILARVLARLKARGRSLQLHEAIAQCSDEELRQAGLSRNKLLAVRDLHAKCLDGTVPTLREAREIADEELIARLTQVRGIGPWTVHMLLIFHLGRPDILPTGDFAIRLAFKNLYGKRRDPTPAMIIKHARRWQPYSSVASWYLWRSLD